ncbi:hypothetical protein [Serratia surfactantfaciens]|uniref:hypothetical protein n=1 Tax=Serratia surfactantfaciens TaxID=2741499 RepID=UPI001B3C7C18|nr:hypothetical protein [Serratia surfactantfaciens]
MDNKLSELSKPVAYSLRFRNMNGKPDKTINANTTFSTLEKAKAYGLGNRYVTQDDGKIVCVRAPSQDPIVEPLYSQEYVSALLEKSKEKDERAIACVNAFDGIETERIAGKSLGEFLAGELYLNKAEPKQDGSFGFTFSGLAVQLMADCFADQFKSSGAINYLELLFEHAEVGEMTVTMQRVEGLTPAQKLAAAEQRIAELEEQSEQFKKELHNESAANAHAYERIRELEKRLATPVRLPEKYNMKMAGDKSTKSMFYGHNSAINDSAKAIRAAGFAVEGDSE